jgi:hypothetical protein
MMERECLEEGGSEEGKRVEQRAVKEWGKHLKS